MHPRRKPRGKKRLAVQNGAISLFIFTIRAQVRRVHCTVDSGDTQPQINPSMHARISPLCLLIAGSLA